MEARRRALALAQIRDAEEAVRRAEDEMRRRREDEEASRRDEEGAEAARRAAEEAARPSAPVEEAAEPEELRSQAGGPAVGERRAETRPSAETPGSGCTRPAPAWTVAPAVRGRRGTESEEDERRRSSAGAARGKVVRPEPAKPAPTRPKGEEEPPPAAS